VAFGTGANTSRSAAMACTVRNLAAAGLTPVDVASGLAAQAEAIIASVQATASSQ
jgi:hypothetical protein